MNPDAELNAHIKTCYSLLTQLESKDQLIAVLRNDLDDVRMAYCSLLASYSVTLGVKQDAEQIAKSFGWSCYDRADQ